MNDFPLKSQPQLLSVLGFPLTTVKLYKRQSAPFPIDDLSYELQLYLLTVLDLETLSSLRAVNKHFPKPAH